MDEIIDGKYKIIKLLGRGSFGSVYLAENLGTQKKVVVKLSREGIEENYLKIFNREARVSALLNHPNIASVFDFGITEDNRPFLVREYVEGRTLDDILRQSHLNNEKLKLSEALSVIKAIASGLTVAHRNNIIHRDLKPSNIIIPQISGALSYERAIILDFGSFGELFEKGREAITMTGEFFGTPKYMAPEQLRAEGQTTATDIYGLGMMLYEMIYNRLPFQDHTIASIMRSKMSGELYFPSDGKIPPKIVDFLRRCLSVNQKDRIQTADEVIEQIRDLQLLTKSTASVSILLPNREKGDYEEQVVSQFSPASDLSVVKTVAYYPNVKILCYVILGVFAVPLIMVTFSFLREKGLLTLGTFSGVGFVILGIAASLAVRHLVKIKQTEIGKDAQDLLFGTKSRDMMTQSLAIQVDVLISKINRVDDKILGMSLAIMVKEFEETKESPHRQSALMNVVQLLEKISLRLSPWYVRHDKLVAVMVALVGILSGITTITVTIINMTKGK